MAPAAMPPPGRWRHAPTVPAWLVGPDRHGASERRSHGDRADALGGDAAALEAHDAVDQPLGHRDVRDQHHRLVVAHGARAGRRAGASDASGSTPAVGSSSTSTGKPRSSARASAMRCA